MPTPTYIPLATVTLGTAASSVTFSSIPATFRDLVLVIAGTATTGTQFLQIRFNSDTGNNYAVVRMYSGPSSDSFSSQPSANIGEITTNLTNSIVQVMDYSATDKHKTFLSRANDASRQVLANAGRYANTAAITSVTVVMASSTLAAGTTASLYGIAA